MIETGKQKPLMERLSKSEYVSDKEIQSGLNSLMRTNISGSGKMAKKLGAKMNLGFAKHL